MPKRRLGNNTNQNYGVLHYGRTTVSRAATGNNLGFFNIFSWYSWKEKKENETKNIEILSIFLDNKKHGNTFKYKNQSRLKRR